MYTKLKFLVMTAAGCLFGMQAAQAVPVIAYEWTEGGAGSGTNSIHNSYHSTFGPVLADDFTSSATGNVIRVDWWGNAGVPGFPNRWEITFHNDDPAGTPSFPYLSQHFVDAGGVDPDMDGVFFYTASWNPEDMFVTAGEDYWFSVANASTNNWVWANAGGAGPTVGSEQYTAAVSHGGTPSQIAGPHDGPWTSIYDTAGNKQDFGFRIWVDVPAPGSMVLLSLGLLGLIGLAYGRERELKHKLVC